MNIEFFGPLTRYKNEISEIENYLSGIKNFTSLEIKVYISARGLRGPFPQTCGRIKEMKKACLDDLIKIAEEGGIKIYGPKHDKLAELLLYLAGTPHKEMINRVEVWVK